jgi:IS30 family transposase
MSDGPRYTHLCLTERTHIRCRLNDGWSAARIAAELGRAPSSIRREITRNGGERRYDPARAQRAAVQRRRPQRHWLDEHPDAAVVVVEHLENRRSPAQALVLAAEQLGAMLCSKESVYAWMYNSVSELAVRARAAMTRPRRWRRGRKKSGTRGQIPGMTPVTERPVGLDGREQFGHWEGDLVCGGGTAAVITLVERVSRFTITVKVDDRKADTVSRALRGIVKRHPGWIRTITWDRGKELAGHAQFTAATGVPVYFCAAHCPWQRGTNENTNGVLRRWHPKGTRFDTVTARQLAHTQDWLNTRPMPTLSWSTPTEALTRELRALQT